MAIHLMEKVEGNTAKTVCGLVGAWSQANLRYWVTPGGPSFKATAAARNATCKRCLTIEATRYERKPI